MRLLAAGFFLGAWFRGYRIAAERHDLDAGWRGGWEAVKFINVACFVIAVYLADSALMRPPSEQP